MTMFKDAVMSAARAHPEYADAAIYLVNEFWQVADTGGQMDHVGSEATYKAMKEYEQHYTMGFILGIIAATARDLEDQARRDGKL